MLFRSEDVLVTVLADLSALEPDSFWVVLDARGWTHPYDEHGKRRDFADVPKSVTGLRDDPFRSLAGELRRAGGYAVSRRSNFAKPPERALKEFLET